MLPRSKKHHTERTLLVCRLTCMMRLCRTLAEDLQWKPSTQRLARWSLMRTIAETKELEPKTSSSRLWHKGCCKTRCLWRRSASQTSRPTNIPALETQASIHQSFGLCFLLGNRISASKQALGNAFHQVNEIVKKLERSRALQHVQERSRRREIDDLLQGLYHLASSPTLLSDPFIEPRS